MTVLLNIMPPILLLCTITSSPLRGGGNREDAAAGRPRRPGADGLVDNEHGGDTPTPAAASRSGVAARGRLWPNATVPYRISRRFSAKEIDMIQKGMKIIEFWTCVRFVPYDGEYDLITIVDVDGMGCRTNDIGFNGGDHEVFLEATECFSEPGYVIHELLHSIGVIHEHSRPDRDKYVTIHEDNVAASSEAEVTKYPDDGSIDTFGVPYDYNSIMHYAKTTASVGHKVSIEPKLEDGKRSKMGQNEGLSVRDVIKIRNMYNCYYDINYSEHSSRVLPNVDKVTGPKRELWNTFFRNFNYSHPQIGS